MHFFYGTPSVGALKILSFFIPSPALITPSPAQITPLPDNKFLNRLTLKDWFLYDNCLRHERVKGY